MSDVVDARERRPPVGLAAPRPDAHLIDLISTDAVVDLTRRGDRSTPPVPTTEEVDHAVAIAIAGHTARDGLAERWLTAAERTAADALGPRARAGRVGGRIAAKQAIASHLISRGFADLAPERVQITNDGYGAPVVAVRSARIATRHLRISIAHAGAVAVALASTSRRATGIGIDVEPVEARSPRFEALTLAVEERRLVPAAGDDRDTWLTRLWAAKEAAAKATGLGLRGRPKDFVVTGTAGTRLRIAGRWIATERVELAGTIHIVASTEDHRTECSWHRS